MFMLESLAMNVLLCGMLIIIKITVSILVIWCKMKMKVPKVCEYE